MGYGDVNKWTPPRESGGTPSVSTRFSVSMENEQADADWTAELVSRGANVDREIFIFPVQLTTIRIGNHTGMIPTLLQHM